MATKTSSVLLGDVTTDARFQALVQFIDAALLAGGWVLSSDSGQANPATIAHPTVANTKQGYRIYKMGDTLQATSPVFMRIDFGSNSTVSTFAWWITIGSGSDGAGNITNVTFNGGARLQGFGMNSPSTTPGNSYASVGPARCAFAILVNNSAGAACYFLSVERSKDANGNDTGDGVMVFWSDYANGGNYFGPSFCRYVILAGGAQPAQETGLNYICSTTNPSDTFAPGDVGVGIPFCFKGVAQQPGMNLCIVSSLDVGAEGNFQIRMYGQTITFQHLNSVSIYKGLSGSANQDQYSRVCMRFD